MCGAMLRQQTAIGGVIGFAKKGLLPPISALGDMMWNAGKHEAGKAGDD